MIVDLRSDTVTKPSKEMLDFMMNSPIGDDVFEEDPTINELEKYAAELFGMEAGLFCTSGTQTNQIAINVHTSPGDEVICHEEAHIYRYEGGGMARNCQVSARFLRGNFGRINPLEIEENINPDNLHYPVTTLVCIEDTANRGGGKVYDFNDIKIINKICNKNNLKFHLDGARVFNALEITGISPKEYGSQFDSISICLSKGLGAPVGSVLIGTKKFIHKARRVRKFLGGGMRQAGIIAGGGLYALKNNINRLKDDHVRALKIESILAKQDWIKEVIPTETNIVVGILKNPKDQTKILEQLKSKGILAIDFGNGRIRMTTHLDITDEHIKYLEANI
jgi:threonine aldolase